MPPGWTGSLFSACLFDYLASTIVFDLLTTHKRCALIGESRTGLGFSGRLAGPLSCQTSFLLIG